MNYIISVNALWGTCEYTLQTSEPRIHPKMPQTDEPERQQQSWGVDFTLEEDGVYLRSYKLSYRYSLYFFYMGINNGKENTNFVQLKIVKKFPETITELHKIPVHWILELGKQTNCLLQVCFVFFVI